MNLALSQELISQKYKLNTQVLDRPEEFVRSLTGSEIAILNYFIEAHYRYKYTYTTQETIAKFTGYVEKTVLRAVKKFKALNIFYVVGRSYTSNMYFMNKAFCNKEMMHKLKFLLSAFMRVSWLVGLNVTLVSVVVFKDVNKLVNKKLFLGGGFVRKYEVEEKVEVVFRNIREKMGLGEIVKPDDILSPGVKALKKYGFSLEERIRMSQFSEETIVAVTKLLLQAKNVKDRVGWFYAVCRKRDAETSVAASMQLASTLLDGTDLSGGRREEPALIKATPIIERKTEFPKTGMKKLPSLEKAQAIVKTEAEWQEDREQNYERIELENMRKPATTPLWLLSNPYSGRISAEFKESVAKKVAAYKASLT